MDYKNIFLIKKIGTKWHLIVTLTCGIAMSRGTDNAMCHT